MIDPDFGNLVFIYISNDPGKSYWECEWNFPKTGTIISIGLPGNENGPLAESREFFLNIPEQFEGIIQKIKPNLNNVFQTWLGQSIPTDLWSAVKLAGFGLEDPKANPIQWDIAFETLGDKWLGITIPFVGDEPQETIVDT
jgi:hypothetical protein